MLRKMWKLTSPFLKSFLLVVLALFLSSDSVSAQRKKIDSLHRVLIPAKEDTVAINNLRELSSQYYWANKLDSAVLYAMQSKRLATKLNSEKQLVRSLDHLLSIFVIMGNHLKMLETSLEMLKLGEQMKDTLGIVTALTIIGSTYDELEDFEQALTYQKKAYHLLLKAPDKEMEMMSANLIGYYYIELNMPDSALAYYQKAYEMTNRWKDTPHAQYAWSLYGLGKVNYQLGNVEISIPYYRKSVEYAKQDSTPNHSFVLLLSYAGIAEIFKDSGNKDSAFIYFNKALEANPAINRVKLNTYRSLVSMYEGADDHIAVKYLKLEAALRDSLFNSKKTKEVQSLTYNEQERQQQIIAQHIEEKDRLRKQKKKKKHRNTAAIALRTISPF